MPNYFFQMLFGILSKFSLESATCLNWIIIYHGNY